MLCHWNSHIYEDECGAPEFYTSGAKLVPLKGAMGKIDPQELDYHSCRGNGDVHMVQPTAVSITQITESGTAYSVSEVQVFPNAKNLPRSHELPSNHLVSEISFEMDDDFAL